MTCTCTPTCAECAEKMMDELPPLPEPTHSRFAPDFSADQMRAYAATAVAKERERCAVICEQTICPCCFDESATAAAEYLAECIRATQATPPPPAAS